MKRVLVLLPLLLAGCRPGRQAAVSNDGRVASTTDAGTFVAGRGRVTEGGSDLAWSPDGSALAVATKEGVTLWPKGGSIERLAPPIAWSPYGDAIAGTADGKVRIRNLLTSETREAALDGTPQSLRWVAGERLLSVEPNRLQVEGAPPVSLPNGTILDAVATIGGIVYLQSVGKPERLSDLATSSLRLGRWQPGSDALNVAPVAKADDLFGGASPRRVAVPLAFALAPDGTHFAAAGVRLESTPRAIARLKALADAPKPTKAQQSEVQALLKAVRTTHVVLRVDSAGHAETIWTSPATEGDWRTDLTWSPDGAWLAIARKDGTVRIAAGP